MILRKKNIKYLITFLLVITFLLSFGGVALADYLNGYYWPEGPDPLTYRFFNYPDPEMEISQATQDAFTMAQYYWETATNSPVEFTYTTGSADIYCFEILHDGTDASGWWDPASTYGYELYRAHAVLNTYKTAGYPSGKRISVAGHELGHCLGLDHHLGTLMTEDDWWRWEVWGIESPKTEDIYELNDLY